MSPVDIILQEKIEKLLDTQNVVFISSVDEDGFPNTKAMLSPRKRKGLKTIYFSTNTSSVRVSHFLKNGKASLYFYDENSFQGVMLKGIMTVHHEEDLKMELWHQGDELFYPKGVTDPDYCVLIFTAQQGRYYSNLKSVNFAV